MVGSRSSGKETGNRFIGTEFQFGKVKTFRGRTVVTAAKSNVNRPDAAPPR